MLNDSILSIATQCCERTKGVVVQEGCSTVVSNEELSILCGKLKGQLALALMVLMGLGFDPGDFTDLLG